MSSWNSRANESPLQSHLEISFCYLQLKEHSLTRTVNSWGESYWDVPVLWVLVRICFQTSFSSNDLNMI
jgi:hypothetical protein